MNLGLRPRLIILFFAGCFAYSWYWAQYESPRAKIAAARADGYSRCEPDRVIPIHVSVSKYPDNWRHIVDARRGRNTHSDGTTINANGLRWPSVLVKNDSGEDARRQAAFRIAGVTKTKPGMARDEYPPAVGRSSDAADIRYVPSRPNSAQGASMGGQLRSYCNGQQFRLVAVP